MKKRIYWNKSGLVVWLLLLLCSCGEETPGQEAGVPQAVQVRCEATIDATGYDSDSELVPMGTTRASGSHVVTQLKSSALLVVKKLPNNEWAVMERRENLIFTSNLQKRDELRNNEKLVIENLDCVLLPGEYKFLLFINHITLNDDIFPGATLTGKELIATRQFVTFSDFFFASQDVTLEKTNGLTEGSDGNIKRLSFILERHSALLRFIIEGEGLNDNSNSTIEWEVEGKDKQPFCIGMNLLGEDVMSVDPQQQNTEIPETGLIEYIVGGKSWLFSKTSVSNNSPAIYATEKVVHLDLSIKKIWSILTTKEFFKGPHTLESVPVQRNHITTIVIRKIGDNKIETVLNPTVSDWNAAYPPLNYVELNNN